MESTELEEQQEPKGQWFMDLWHECNAYCHGEVHCQRSGEYQQTLEELKEHTAIMEKNLAERGLELVDVREAPEAELPDVIYAAHVRRLQSSKGLVPYLLFFKPLTKGV